MPLASVDMTSEAVSATSSSLIGFTVPSSYTFALFLKSFGEKNRLMIIEILEVSTASINLNKK